jgi:putative nucleotidyltransferase with HDIG domain
MSSVLVIDDEAAVRQLMTRWARMAGYRVTTASNADEALDQLSLQAPAIALCDVRMPGRDGLWLADRIRRDYPDTAVIVATGARDTDPRLANYTGAVDCLLKPFGRDRLRFALERGIDWHNTATKRRRWVGQLADELRSRHLELEDAVAGIDRLGAEQLEALLALIDDGDPLVLEHARRVAAISVKVAETLGVTGKDLAAIRAGALLHDLGKLALPSSILTKPAELSFEEKEIVRRHPAIGAELLRSLDGFDEVAAIVNSAREWYDGRGYPQALAGEAIPLGGRIVAVVDAFDAMTRSQIYRDAMPSSDALREILRCSNSQFDPVVVSSLLQVLGEFAARH